MSGAVSVPRPPAKTRVRVVEDSPQRLVLHIAGGGPRARGLGCFALFWNGFMCVFTPPWFFVMWQNPGGGPPGWFIIPFLGIFWAVGLGMAYWWARMRFTRLNLLVEPQQIAVQKLFFRRSELEETAIAADSTIDLVESYQENDSPVYAIAVSGVDDTIKFGTALSDDDKRFLVRKMRLTIGQTEGGESAREAISRHFPGNCESCGSPLPRPGQDDVAAVCERCGRSHSGELVAKRRDESVEFADLDPSQLWAETQIAVNHADAARLDFTFPTIDPRWKTVATFVAIGVGAGFATFLLIPLNFVNAVIGGGGLGDAKLLMIAGLYVVLPLLMAISVRRSSVRVDINDNSFRCLARLGPIPIRRSVPLQSIERVVLTDDPSRDTLVRSSRPSPIAVSLGSHRLTCVLEANDEKVPITWGHNPTTTREVAGLIRGQLRKMGRDV